MTVHSRPSGPKWAMSIWSEYGAGRNRRSLRRRDLLRGQARRHLDVEGISLLIALCDPGSSREQSASTARSDTMRSRRATSMPQPTRRSPGSRRRSLVEAARRTRKAGPRRRLPGARPDHAGRLPRRAVAADQEGAAAHVDVQLVPEEHRAAREPEDRDDPTAEAAAPRTSTRSTPSCSPTGSATAPVAAWHPSRCGSSMASCARPSPTPIERAASPATWPTYPTHRRCASAAGRP